MRKPKYGKHGNGPDEVQGQKIIHALQLYKIPLVPLLVSTLGEQPLS